MGRKTIKDWVEGWDATAKDKNHYPGRHGNILDKTAKLCGGEVIRLESGELAVVVKVNQAGKILPNEQEEEHSLRWSSQGASHEGNERRSDEKRNGN